MKVAKTLKPGGRRSRRQVVRGAIISLVTLLAFILVLQVSIAGAFRSAAPQLALAWVPFDSQARSKLASGLIERDGSARARSTARVLAIEAIRRDALSPVALRVLAQVAGQRPNGERQAATLMFEAERLTRRDRAAQLWLVQHSIRRGDVSEAMRHFDIALRTSERGQSMVFPLLATAANEPALAKALIVRLKERPVWAVPFMVYMIDEGPDQARTVALAREVLDPKDERELGLIRSLLQRLGSKQEAALAWEVYTHFGLDKAASASLLQGGDFEKVSGLEPFAWILADDSELWAARQRDPAGSGFVLQLGAASDKSGEIARQLIRLRPGSYQLQARMGSIPQEAAARPRIIVRCAEGGETSPLLTVVAAEAGAEARQLRGNFSVPSGCNFQWLAVEVSAGNAEPTEYPWLDDVRLTTAGG